MSADPLEPLRRAIDAPDWFPLKLDPAGRRTLFVRLAEPDLRDAEFLDDRVLQKQREGFWAPTPRMLDEASALPPRTAHGIFHIGHCGSTLLANLLEALPGVLALREPMALRTIAELHEERDDALARVGAGEVARTFDRFLALYARPHATGQRVVVKATSRCNALVDPWLARDHGARAVLLHIALEPYLANILKSPGSRSDCNQFAPGRLRYLHALLGDDGIRLGSLDDAETVAMGWLAELARFRALDARWPGRCLSLDFDALLREGAPAFARIAAHLGLPHDEGAVARAWSPTVLGRYAKARGHAYGAADRAADLDEARRRHREDISRGLAWAHRIVARYPVLAGLVDR